MSSNKEQIDINSLSEEDRAFYNKYGRLPPSKQILASRLKNGDRKYFDSGDYAMSKAGKTTSEVGSAHPSPERIPHSIPSNMKKENGPIRESNLNKST